MRVGVWVAAAVLMVVALGCKRGDGSGGGTDSHGVHSAGVLVSNGIAADLRVTPDRKQITFLTDAMKPRLDGIPPQMLLGVLQVLPVGGGKARRLGTGVTNVPGGYLVSPDSRWALYLEGFNAAAHAGVLHAVDLQDPASDPVKLDNEVTYLLPSPDSHWIAYVRGGVLKVGKLPSGPFREVAGEVTVAQFSPDSAFLAFKRSQAAAGGLGLVKVAGSEPLKKLADQVGDYGFSPDSKRIALAVRSTVTPGTFDSFSAAVAEPKPVKVATACSGFAFSPDGKWLARTEGARVVEAVNFVGDLVVGPADGSGGDKVGTSVNGTGFGFSPDSTQIAALEKFDFTKGREWGSLVLIGLKDRKPKELAKRVKTFLWAPDSKALALQPIEFSQEYGPSANLLVYRPGDEVPKQVLTGVWGYSFDPKSRYAAGPERLQPWRGGRKPSRVRPLQHRPGHCTAGAEEDRGCDLQLQDDARRREGPRHVRGDRPGHLQRRHLRDGLGQPEDAGSAHPAAGPVRRREGNDRVAYVVAERSRAGVYLAPLDAASARAAQ